MTDKKIAAHAFSRETRWKKENHFSRKWKSVDCRRFAKWAFKIPDILTYFYDSRGLENYNNKIVHHSAKWANFREVVFWDLELFDNRDIFVFNHLVVWFYIPVIQFLYTYLFVSTELANTRETVLKYSFWKWLTSPLWSFCFQYLTSRMTYLTS